MSGRVFLDTNLLIYFSDAAAGAKQVRATEILAELTADTRAVVSTQVLQEYFVTAVGKLKMPAEAARANVERFSQLEVVLVRPELVLGAIDLHRLNRISFWDALIVRCASAAGCSRLLTEDLNDGQTIDGVRIENPFLATAGHARERRPAWGGRSRSPRREAAR